MPIKTDLSGSPYFDDFDETKNYHKILFKPGVGVQTRELNQLQTILQNQIERFGDNILQRGTIVEGCNFSYYNNYPYAKINDAQVDGEPTVVPAYIGHYVRNTANLTAFILDGSTGFQSQDPNLNTVYLRYINSGNDNAQTAFNASDILTVFDINNPIQQVNIINGGKTFSNTDTLVFLSAMVVSVSSSNTFTNGELVTQSTTNAKAQIIEVNTTAIANSLVLKLKPVTSDLTSGNSAGYAFNTGYNITSNTTGSVANVTQIIGSAAVGNILTDSQGIVQQVIITNNGYDYVVNPYVTIAPVNPSADLNSLNLQPQNYIAQVTVSTVANAVGSAYAFGVSEGVIYQKGYFLKVAPQTIVVEPYSNAPDDKSVGFNTAEALINADIDPSLFDNATGTTNEFAPGADRLKLTPYLVVLTKADADSNSEFFPLTEFSLGLPYKQNQKTAYSTLDDEMSRRLFESSGNFVLDPFLLSTKTAQVANDAPGYFRVTIDPGHAYINGKRVKTYTNYSLKVRKGIDTVTSNAATISMNYGNYVDTKELGGSFEATTGPLVYLYDTAKQFYTSPLTGYANATSANLDPASGATQIGTARIRNGKLLSGIAGTPDAVYRYYLYDINIANGYNFRSTKSIYGNNATLNSKGIADVLLTYDASTASNIAYLANTNNSRMVFPAPANATSSTANHTYYYRNTQRIAANNSAGTITISNLGSNEYHPYTNGAVLTSDQVNTLHLVPNSDLIFSTNIATNNANTFSNTTLVVPSTAGLYQGDVVLVYQNGGVVDKRRIISVVNSTYLTLYSNLSSTKTGANVVQVLPASVPIPMDGIRPNRNANLDSTGKILTVSLGNVFTSNALVIVNHNVKIQNTNTTQTKTANRNTMVKLDLSTHIRGTTGPWSVGHPDVFRLKAVYLGNTSTVNTNSVDVTNQFYIDHNQNFDYHDLSYLYLKPNSNLTLSNTQGLLAVFDHYTQSNPGLVTISSYSVNTSADAYTVANLASSNTISIHEISEIYSSKGQYLDLINAIDFRPRVQVTANITTNTTNLTTNPPEVNATAKFSYTGTPIKQPSIDSTFTADITQYMGRVDRIVIDTNANIRVIEGTPGLDNLQAPDEPADTMTINLLYIPPYPSIPDQKASNLVTILDKKIANQKFTVQRDADHAIAIPVIPDTEIVIEQPARYSMEDIANLDRRLTNIEQAFSLSQLEQEVQHLAIPSSINASIDRFKYGFFADDFSTTNYTDTSSPEYSATIENNEVVPRKSTRNFEFNYDFSDDTTEAVVSGDKTLHLPFKEFSLINQSSATDGPVVVVSNNVVVNVSSQSIVCAFVTGNNSGVQAEYTASVTANTITFVYGSNDTDNDRLFSIYQANTKGFSITGKSPIKNQANGVALSTAQLKDYLSSVTTANGTISNSQLKIISFTHNPAAGQYYQIYTSDEAGGLEGIWAYRFCYPIDGTTNIIGTANTSNNVIINPTSNNIVINPSSNAVISANAVVITIPPANYGGSITATPSSIRLDSVLATTSDGRGLMGTNHRRVPTTYLSAANKISVVATGLKPGTKHTFYFDSIDSTQYCISNGAYVASALLPTLNSIFYAPGASFAAGLTPLWTSGNHTNNMVSDASGKLQFDFYFAPDLALEANISSVATTASDLATLQAKLNALAGNKVISLNNSDNTSVATYTLTLISGNVASNSTSSNTVINSKVTVLSPNTFIKS